MDESADLSAAFGLPDRAHVAIVGAGGKSSLLFAFGRILRQKKQPTILTTTTRLGIWQINHLASRLAWPQDATQLRTALDQFGVTFLFSETRADKVIGIGSGECDRLFASEQASYIIIEADGARGLPIKAPAAHEPVIPATATHVIVCMGIDAIGERIADVVFRPKHATQILNCLANLSLTPQQCANLLTDADGGLRGVSTNMSVSIFINKVATEKNIAYAREIAGYALKNQRISRVVAGNTRSQQPVLAVWKRASC